MNKNNVITLKLNEQEQNALYDAFHESKVEKTPPYARYQLRVENCVITCYESGKVVFQGKDANVYASSFHKEEVSKPKQNNTLSINKNTYPQAGSDEVGTGDYFGPVCVCATIVCESDVTFLQKLGVQDSKALTDEKILEIAPAIMERLTYSLLIVEPEKYNVVHEFNNMNAIKAKLHNQAYVNLKAKGELPSFLIVDQFTPGPSYYRYLQSEPTIISGIHFETKAENKYLSVASGSIISRYAFLQYFEGMSQKYNMTFLKGAGTAVDDFAKEFVDRYGFEELKYVAKLHFKNTEKLSSQ